MRVLVSISTTDPQKELHIKFTNKSSERLFNELYNDHLQMAQDVHNDEGCEEDNPVEDCPFERLIKYRRIFEQEEDWENAKIIYNKILPYETEEVKFVQERIEWIDKNRTVAP